jgi:hypothetical protein
MSLPLRPCGRYNSDFALEWPRPLPPNVQLVGALLPRSARPLPPQFEVTRPSRSRSACLLGSPTGYPSCAPRRCSHAPRLSEVAESSAGKPQHAAAHARTLRTAPMVQGSVICKPGSLQPHTVFLISHL